MNKRVFLEKEMKVNWATSSAGNQPKTDISQHHHIFVGDLSPEIETETLREAFAPFGEISNCRIVRDPQTLKSKGYAFVSFVKQPEAENAIQAMNGQWLGSRSIRTNWSTRKPPPPRESYKGGVKGIMGKTADYEEIYHKTSATNTTVYCGGFPQNFISDDIIHKHFSQFGAIQDIRVFKDKGYAFIKFTTKEAAAHAIEGTNNSDVYGHSVKCFWGKENGGDMGSGSMMGTMANSNSIHNIQGPGIIIPPHTPTNNHSQHLQQQQPGAPYASYAYQYWYPVSRINNIINNFFYHLLINVIKCRAIQHKWLKRSTCNKDIPLRHIRIRHTLVLNSKLQLLVCLYEIINCNFIFEQCYFVVGYRMAMQPTAAQWGLPASVPSVATNGSSNYANGAAAAAGAAQQMMYTTMPQFQTQ